MPRTRLNAVLSAKPLRKGYDPVADWQSVYQTPQQAWWPATFPSGFEGEKVKPSGRGAAIVIVPSGDSATVWLYEYNT